MRDLFAHDALLTIEPGVDVGAPGAAVTTALCGHWDHEPPCPLAPHHTSVERVDRGLRLHILFVAEPNLELVVRELIEQGLSSAGQQPGGGRGGARPRWQVLTSEPGRVREHEMDHAERLRRS